MRLLDAHVDTITALWRDNGQLLDNARHVSLKKLSAFDTPVIFFAVFLHKARVERLFPTFLEAYGFLNDQVVRNGGAIALARDYADILSNMEAGRVSAVPAIEEGGILEGSMDKLYKAAELGVRYITLTWNFENEIGEPSAQNGGGLKSFGRELIREMNGLGVLADVSHLSEQGFWDVYNLSAKPFIASHSNSKAICGHHRNLTDDQLRAIGEKGGCAGVNFCAAFLSEDGDKPDKRATIDDICRHVDRMLKYAGERAVGLGTDFDGVDSLPAGISDASSLPALYGVFTERYGAELTERIFFQNFMDVLKSA